MKVKCLGTGGFHDTETTRTACYMIPEAGIVFDAGTGFFRVSKLVKTPYLEIFLSHGHADHTGGLHCILEIYEMTQCKDITVYAEEHVIKAIEIMFSHPLFPLRPQFSTKAIKPGDTIITKSNDKITTFALDHKGPCLGYKLEHNDHTFAYVTDTHSTKESTYINVFADVDLLFHECYTEGAKAAECASYKHTDSISFAEVCKLANVKKAVTIHHNPNGDRQALLEEILPIFPNTQTSSDNAEFEF